MYVLYVCMYMYTYMYIYKTLYICVCVLEALVNSCCIPLVFLLRFHVSFIHFFHFYTILQLKVVAILDGAFNYVEP